MKQTTKTIKTWRVQVYTMVDGDIQIYRGVLHTDRAKAVKEANSIVRTSDILSVEVRCKLVCFDEFGNMILD